MTDHHKIEDAAGRTPTPPRGTSGSPSMHRRQRRRRRTPRRKGAIVSLTLWAGAALSFYVVADAIAAGLGSWLIGCVSAGTAGLFVLAMLSAATTRKPSRRS